MMFDDEFQKKLENPLIQYFTQLETKFSKNIIDEINKYYDSINNNHKMSGNRRFKFPRV